MRGEKELKILDLEKELNAKQREFDLNRKAGLTDYNLLQEINDIKTEIESLNTCDIDGECLSCGS